VVDFSNTEIGNELSTIADDIDFWERSPLRLFENDIPLGPPHALHYQIRRDGGGKYSHWQNRLLFSTSDNSNPNNNGRIYSFDLQADSKAQTRPRGTKAVAGSETGKALDHAVSRQSVTNQNGGDIGSCGPAYWGRLVRFPSLAAGEDDKRKFDPC
jgi:hypothetical protein